MIKIELQNEEGIKETFIKEYVSGRNLRQVMDFATKAEESELSALEQLDELIYLVVSLFKNDKVSFDTILDGISSDKLGDTLGEIISDVMGGEKKDGGKPDKTKKK
jgi:hypothetical protein